MNSTLIGAAVGAVPFGYAGYFFSMMGANDPGIETGTH